MGPPPQTQIEEGANHIYRVLSSALQKKEGCLIGRNGTVELEAILFYVQSSMMPQTWPKGLADTLERHAGIFPSSSESISKWAKEMLEAIRITDVIAAGWYEPLKASEDSLLRFWNLHAPRIPLRSLEPYYVRPDLRWTNLLDGKRVAIVNAFAETAVEQTQKAEEVWPGGMNETLLPPTTTWIPIQTGYAPILAQGQAEWPLPIRSWQEAVDYIIEIVKREKADITLIGCGGLGMIVGAKLKQIGIPCIVLGGALQVLFGIKGQRWSQHDTIRRFWNEAWVFPKPSETPVGAARIEGSCYWAPPT